MLGFADKPYAERALFGLSFAEASFFPIPPDPLLVAMGAGRPDRALRFALITSLASVLGALAGYAIGALLMDTVGEWLLGIYDPERAVWGKILSWYEEYGALALLLAALTPIPFKVFTIASGALGFPLVTFVLASAVGRTARFGAEGVLLRFFGKPVAVWIDKWFDWVAVGFMVLLVGGFFAIKAIG